MRHTKDPNCGCARCIKAKKDAHAREVAPFLLQDLAVLLGGHTLPTLDGEITLTVENIPSVDWRTNNFVGSKRRALYAILTRHGVL